MALKEPKVAQTAPSRDQAAPADGVTTPAAATEHNTPSQHAHRHGAKKPRKATRNLTTASIVAAVVAVIVALAVVPRAAQVRSSHTPSLSYWLPVQPCHECHYIGKQAFLQARALITVCCLDPGPPPTPACNSFPYQPMLLHTPHSSSATIILLHQQLIILGVSLAIEGDQSECLPPLYTHMLFQQAKTDPTHSCKPPYTPPPPHCALLCTG